MDVNKSVSFDMEFCALKQIIDGLDMNVNVRTSAEGGTYVLPTATQNRLGGIKVGDDLQITPEGVLSVVKANAVERDNTRPITSAAVYTEVGNIEALLAAL